MLGQHFLRSAQGQRESAWQALDAESPGIPGHLPPLQAIRRRAIDSYVQNGGDLGRLHRQAALDMSRRLLAMELLLGHNTPYVVPRGLHPYQSVSKPSHGLGGGDGWR